ncbi:MAG: hypothetical protein U9R02_04360 [Thermodesulfobacteriota bacterium]|nr:hypothetical protein [Thermodesulfobacteriota bacterium]
MKEIHLTLAVEDVLSEVVTRKLIEQTQKNYRVTQCLRKGGFGYLKSKINAFNKAASGFPFFVLTDQDSINECPPDKIANWLNQPRNLNMIFRIAVMEVESWVMADRKAFAKFLSIPLTRIPQDTDSIPDPKEFLISLARKSRSSRLRADLVPSRGATSKQGPDYNSHLTRFVRKNWDAHTARNNSESLNKAFMRLEAFTPVTPQAGMTH